VRASVRQPYSPQSRTVFYMTVLLYALMAALYYIFEQRVPDLDTEWIVFVPPALFVGAVLFFSASSLSAFRIDKRGVKHVSLFGPAIGVLPWSEVRFAEVITASKFAFSPVYIVLSDRRHSRSDLQRWMDTSPWAQPHSGGIYCVPYTAKTLRMVNDYSPIKPNSIATHRSQQSPKRQGPKRQARRAA